MWIDSGSSGFQDNFTCQKIFFSFFFVEEGRQVDCNFYTKCFSSGSEHLYGTIGVLLLHLHYLLHANIVSYYGTFFILEKWLVPPPLTIGCLFRIFCPHLPDKVMSSGPWLWYLGPFLVQRKNYEHVLISYISTF